MPRWIGDSARSSSQISRAVWGRHQAAPSRRATSWTTSRSSRAPGGGSSAFRIALDAAVARRHRALRLAPAGGGRQDDVRELRRPREEEVLDDQEVEPAEGLLDVVRVRVGDRRVLADDVERVERALGGGLQHLGHVQAARRREADAPALLERAPLGRIEDVLEAGQAERHRAHVAAALDVVLPAQGIEPGAETPDVAGEERQVDERVDVVDRVVVLGDPEGPADDGAVGRRVAARDPADLLGGDAGLALRPLGRGGGDRRAELLVAAGAVVDEPGVLKALGDDDVRDGVGEGDVRAHAEGDVLVGPAGARGPAGVDDHQVGAVPLPLEHVLEHDRMRLAGVRAPEHEDVRLLQLLVGRGAASGTEHGRQPGDRRGVSGPVAAVDVVRADHAAHELLRGVVQLVRGLGAREHADGVRPVGRPWRARARAPRCRARRPRWSGRRTPSTRTRGVVSRPWTPEDSYAAMMASLMPRFASRLT